MTSEQPACSAISFRLQVSSIRNASFNPVLIPYSVTLALVPRRSFERSRLFQTSILVTACRYRGPLHSPRKYIRKPNGRYGVFPHIRFVLTPVTRQGVIN